MWKLVWKGDSRAQTFLLTIHRNEGWKPVVDWWPPSMPSNVTQKQVAGLLQQGSVKVLFYLFFIRFNILSKNLSILTIDSTHLGFFTPKLECISFIYMTVEKKQSVFLLLGILKISTFHRCWLNICVFGIPRVKLKTHNDKSLF